MATSVSCFGDAAIKLLYWTMAASANNKSRRFSSLVFMDFESTGIPSYEFQPRATEVCLIAVERDHFELDEIEEEIRVQNKLRICFYPRRRISPNSTHLTGLSNDNLQNQKPMNEDFAVTLVAFIRRLPLPVCLIAHNGNNFDFPLLQAEIRSVGSVLPDDVFCADSYCAFRNLLEDLSTQVNFLPELSEAARPEEELPVEINDQLPLHDSSDEGDDWFDKVLSPMKCTFESLGFAVDCDDLSSDEGNGLSGDAMAATTADFNEAMAVSNSVTKLKREKTVCQKSDSFPSEVILLDCDDPDCECADCYAQKHKLKLINDEIHIDVSNEPIAEPKQLSGNGIIKGIPTNNNVATSSESTLKGFIRTSVIVPVPRAGSSIELSLCNAQKHSLNNVNKSPAANENEDQISESCVTPNKVDSTVHSTETGDILDDDMDFVVNYVLSPEFKKVEEDIEIECSRQLSDKTPAKSIAVSCASAQNLNRKYSSKDNAKLNGAKDQTKQYEEISPSSQSHDRVRKRLFPEEVLINKPKLDETVPSAVNKHTGVVPKSYETDVPKEQSYQELLRRSPPKKLCNNEDLSNNEHKLDSNLEMDVTVGKNKVQLSNGSSNIEKCRATSTTADPTEILAVPGTSSCVKPVYVSHSPQKTPQPKLKYRYSLEALHELLIGKKPSVSHTAEDDTEALLRVCRMKRTEFCEWIDNHAVRLNRLSPMWVKKQSISSTLRAEVP